MSASVDWTTVSAIVQAISAAVVALLTYFLVRFTGRYVREMARANQLQEQANSISSGLLAQSTATRGATPFIVAAPGPVSGSKGGPARAKMIVENRGAGIAIDVEVETTWGNAHIDALGQSDRDELTFAIDSWDASEHPRVLRFRIKDGEGVEWIQEPGQLPVQAA